MLAAAVSRMQGMMRAAESDRTCTMVPLVAFVRIRGQGGHGAGTNPST